MLFPSVAEAPLPEGALLQQFVESGEYTDCFVTHVDADVAFEKYVECFYTTRLFKAERFVLKRFVAISSSDVEAGELARNERQAFAAWNEHARTDNQLIMMDFRGQTCSWFMTAAEDAGTSLYFGSAVMRRQQTPTGRELRWTYRLLMGLHRLYSRALLRAARSRLIASG